MTTEYKQPEFLRLIFSDLLGHLKSIEVDFDSLNDVLEHGAVIDGSSVKGYASVNESDLLLLSTSATPRFLGNHTRVTLETFSTSWLAKLQSLDFSL
ncbi:MAG: glutamine synthetase [Candidatus Thorarchaeota archaeon]